jgi:hypothetical protein
MKRRSFFGAISAAVAGLFGVASAEPCSCAPLSSEPVDVTLTAGHPVPGDGCYGTIVGRFGVPGMCHVQVSRWDRETNGWIPTEHFIRADIVSPYGTLPVLSGRKCMCRFAVGEYWRLCDIEVGPGDNG